MSELEPAAADGYIPVPPDKVSSPARDDGPWRTAAADSNCTGCAAPILAGDRVRLGGAEHGWVCQACGNGLPVPDAAALRAALAAAVAEQLTALAEIPGPHQGIATRLLDLLRKRER